MTFDEYQADALRTAGSMDLAYQALGLAGEAGEVADLIKKHIGQGHPLDRDRLAKEIGDVLWHAAMLCRVLGLSFGAVAKGNIEKLRVRYPEGFSPERSQDRESPCGCSNGCASASCENM